MSVSLTRQENNSYNSLMNRPPGLEHEKGEIKEEHKQNVLHLIFRLNNTQVDHQMVNYATRARIEDLLIAILRDPSFSMAVPSFRATKENLDLILAALIAENRTTKNGELYTVSENDAAKLRKVGGRGKTTLLTGDTETITHTPKRVRDS